jgi:hypothetical protein
MATAPRTTTKKTETAGSAPVAEEKTNPPAQDYAGQAADLAAQARTLADEAVAALAEVQDAFTRLGDTDRDVAQAPIWEAARRIVVTLLDFVALILAIVAAVWAVMDRTWQLLIVSLAVILLALSPALNVHIH